MYLKEHSTIIHYVLLIFPHTLFYPVYLFLHILYKTFLPEIFAMNLIKHLDSISSLQNI